MEDNFDYKKYLAEGKLQEEEMDLSYIELTDDEKDDVSDMMNDLYSKINPKGDMKKNTGLFRYIDAWFESRGDSLSEGKLKENDKNDYANSEEDYTDEMVIEKIKDIIKYHELDPSDVLEEIGQEFGIAFEFGRG